MAHILNLLEVIDVKKEIRQGRRSREFRHIVRQSKLEQPFGCVETSPAGGRLGIASFINRRKAHHICHWEDTLLCNNDPYTHHPTTNNAQSSLCT